jgi:hypothetical protein
MDMNYAIIRWKNISYLFFIVVPSTISLYLYQLSLQMFLTWPEILGQFALSAGFAPQLKKRNAEEAFYRNDNELRLFYTTFLPR